MTKTIEQQVEELVKQCWMAGDFEPDEPVMPNYKVKEVLETALQERDRIAREEFAEGIKGIKWQLSNDLDLNENQLVEQLNLLDRVQALTTPLEDKKE